MNAIVPIAQLQRRAPEAGRIRLGVKTGNAMKATDTFRFTSPHREAIEKLAELYGGEAQPWNDAKIAGSQWQVLTRSNKIEVLAQPGGCSVWYEKWTGGGCERRCDGETCEVAGHDGMDEVACICVKKGQAECAPYTRVQVILPQLDFYGTWRLQTKGWNAAKELPGMYEMVESLSQGGRMVRAFLTLEPRKSVRNGKTKNFVVPGIIVAATPDELLAGGGVARPQLTRSAPSAGELEAGAVLPRTDEDDKMIARMADEFDAEIVEAEVVDEERERVIEENVRQIAEIHKHDPDIVVATLWDMTNGNYDKLESFIAKSKEGKSLVFTQKGTLAWRASGT